MTARQMSSIIGALLDRGIPSTDVHTLARYLRDMDLYPARDFSCEERPPHIFITYDWRMNFVDLQVAIMGGLQYIAQHLERADPSLVVEWVIVDRIRLWVDFVFIDQSARDVAGELAALPEIVEACDTHFVLSPTALARSWCCYELALFNHRFRPSPTDVPLLHSFLSPSSIRYQGWDATKTTDVADKAYLSGEVSGLFPGGLTQFDGLLMQASLASELMVKQLGDVQMQVAIDHALQAAGRWISGH